MWHLLLVATVTMPLAKPAVKGSQAGQPTVAGFDGDVEITMPTIQEGKTNVAFVYVGPMTGDGGWTLPVTRACLPENGNNVHTAYLEASRGADAERADRSLARQGL